MRNERSVSSQFCLQDFVENADKSIHPHRQLNMLMNYTFDYQKELSGIYCGD